MLPIDIKHAIERLGTSQAEIARAHQVPASTVYAVIHGTGRSRRIEGAIAELLQQSPSELWPHWYGEPKATRRRRMTPSEMYARLQQLEAAVAAARTKAA